jgi:membrane associated rhomboid family serine protease
LKWFYMARSGPITLNLPSFSGATRKLILILLAVFFGDAILGLVLPGAFYSALLSHLQLSPIHVLHGQVWQLVTYLFLPMGILGSFFALLTLWFIGAILEDIRGPRWLYELFFTSAIGGAVVSSAISFTGILGLSPHSVFLGCYAGIFGLLVAVAVLMGDTEFLLFFLVRIKAKYLVAIYILIEIATLLKTDNAFGALVSLSGALCAYLFLRFAGRRSLTSSLSERMYGLRNDYYRRKRRNAAKKFEVYMRKQNRDVHFDQDGHYIEPEERSARDPNDKRWMN